MQQPLGGVAWCPYGHLLYLFRPAIASSVARKCRNTLDPLEEPREGWDACRPSAPLVSDPLRLLQPHTTFYVDPSYL
ncbi:unnamed protein product [Protopolystoma xenopodis]|uniref:Uncharacterized protein n=1 Tax=Protopolystoma xenopodis TaxID=117903 RepID=A0A448XR20_9PLAT|nr:unnamed protein product [Protopolystoma xenopodis]